jgi:hypothetical protein
MQGRVHEEEAYIILEAGAGFQDGVYFSRELAEEVLEDRGRRYPKRHYLLCQIVARAGAAEPVSGIIPDWVWMASADAARDGDV